MKNQVREWEDSKNYQGYLHQQALDTTTPSGKALFQMCGVFAEFERAMISERVKAGLQRASAQGSRLGRPPLTIDVIPFGRDVEQGLTTRELAKKYYISLGSAHKLRVALGTNRG